MRKSIILPLSLLMLATGTAGAKSPKRGVSENQFSLYNQMVVLQDGVSWYYNWGNTPGKGYQNEVSDFTGYEFVPMVWNDRYNADNIREYVKSHPECKYLLGFNEPNFTAQANMTPAKAAEEWPAVQALAKELGLKLVSPALNYSPNPPYTDPVKWMDEFVAIVGNDAFDYVAIHNYGGLGVMKTLANTFHDKYGKDVWVTEFCYWPNEGQANSRVEPEVQIASMMETVEWLEKTPWIYRYAWFKPIGKHENTPTSGSPCFGLIVTENGLGEKHLSPQGYVYTYMSDFDTDRWHAAGTVIPASEYIAQSNLMLGPGAHPEAPLPIEISRFNASAWAEYQIDVPKDGVYNLTLTVSGQGEPVRFDPCLQVFLSEGENLTPLTEAVKFSISGSDDSYTDQTFPIELKAGHRTIRIADQAPYSPSGLRISHLSFSDPSGVETIIEEARRGGKTVYSIDGRRVDPASAGPGVYICNGRKFIVK